MFELTYLFRSRCMLTPNCPIRSSGRCSKRTSVYSRIPDYFKKLPFSSSSSASSRFSLLLFLNEAFFLLLPKDSQPACLLTPKLHKGGCSSKFECNLSLAALGVCAGSAMVRVLCWAAAISSVTLVPINQPRYGLATLQLDSFINSWRLKGLHKLKRFEFFLKSKNSVPCAATTAKQKVFYLLAPRSSNFSSLQMRYASKWTDRKFNYQYSLLCTEKK